MAGYFVLHEAGAAFENYVESKALPVFARSSVTDHYINLPSATRILAALSNRVAASSSALEFRFHTSGSDLQLHSGLDLEIGLRRVLLCDCLINQGLPG